MVVEGFPTGQESAVLCSGGLDSAVLVAHESRRSTVLPIYVSVGLAWEAAERQWMTRLLRSFDPERLKPVVWLGVDMLDVYPASHWAVTGTPPAYDTPDEDVYIVGRNVVLLSKVAVFCAQQGIHRLVVGPLAGNPFPDATPTFFAAMAQALSLGLECPIAIDAPFATFKKSDVVALGASLGVRLDLTLSCMNPTADHHCGACSKCRERQWGFRDASVPDPTNYASAGSSGGRRPK